MLAEINVSGRDFQRFMSENVQWSLKYVDMFLYVISSIKNLFSKSHVARLTNEPLSLDSRNYLPTSQG